MNDTVLAETWSINAAMLKDNFNEVFWLSDAGMYRDNDTTALCPQDANSMAILYNLTTSPEQANAISEGLTRNWNALGAVAPELPDTISPFIGSLEVCIYRQSLSTLSHEHELTMSSASDSYKPTSYRETTTGQWTSSGVNGDTCFTRI